VIRLFLLGIFGSATLPAQQKSVASAPAAMQEFPVVMLQNVTAGKTPVGTEVQAKLVVGTMGEGTVFLRMPFF
jgi:hypothetical protein